MTPITHEIGSLRRIAHTRLPNARVASARCKIKRRIRAAGLPVRWDASRGELRILLRAAKALSSTGRHGSRCG